MGLKNMRLAGVWVLTLLILTSGCRSIKTSLADSMDITGRKSINIVLLGSLILDYHKKNNYWPENRVRLEQAYDSAKIALGNFDTLSFHHEANSLTVNYRFIENPSSPGTVKFVERDSTASEKSKVGWCHDTYGKTNVDFEGQLVFKYDKGYYTCLE